jgi:response regulator of citrate/malate metabolism
LQFELTSLNVEVLRVVTCQQARQLLRTCPPIDLVITDVSLADGNWCDVLREVVEAGIDVNVLVTIASPDARICSEALWRGVYDILVEPYDEQEVCRAIEGAVRNRGSAQSGSLRFAAVR